MRRIVTIILTLLTAVSFAQTANPIFQGSKYYEFRNAVRIDSAFFAPRRDTVITDLSLKAEGMLTYRPQDKTLWYFNGSYWNRIAHGTAFAIDSARLSHDTLYFRYTTGGELAVAMDYYTKEESDNRYVLSPSGRITANWIQAWDQAVSADMPNISNPDLKYLIVNGSAGDTAFTVVGGTGTSDFPVMYAAAAFNKTLDRYFTFLVVRQSGSVYHTDRPLKYDLTADTIKLMWSSYQGQHMTDYGYRNYADNIYDYHKNLASKDYKLYSFYPEDNPTVIPFTAVNGAVQGGLIPGSASPQLLQIQTATINYSQIATMHYRIQQGSVADRGAEWSVNLGKKNGYLETWVGVNRSLPGYARVLFYLDGVLQKIDTVRGAARKLTYNFSGASSGKVQILTGDTQPTDIRVGRTIWYQTDLSTTTKAYTGGKILFVGDSWTQHYLLGGVFFQSSPLRFRARWQADGGDPADIINAGRGGMTSAWGKYYFKYWLDLYKPKFVYIEFYINDANSSSFVGDPSETTWNFSSSDPYSAGTDVDGKVTQAQWIANLKWMRDTAIAHGVTPIILMNTPTGSLTQTQGQSGWFSALRPASQYYDIETFFTSGVYADNSVNAPLLVAGRGVVDTVDTKLTRGGTASISGSYLIELEQLNSASAKGLIIYPKVNYTGSSGKVVSVQNVPTIGSGEVFSIANNGLTTSAVGFSAGASGYAIPPFTITYSSGIARISATNSTTVQDLYIGDSLTGVIRFRTPAVLANFTTSTLPTSGLKRVKGALVYDTDVDKAAVTNGSSWEYLAKESLVLARYDSTSAKNNFIRNSAAYAGSPQTADILNLGTMRNDGTLIVNGNARFNLGSDLKWDMWMRDSATGNMLRLPAGTFGSTLKAGPGGKPEWAASGTVTSVDLSLPNIFSVTGNPVTTTGTLTATLVSQSQNLVFASPSGSSGVPTFRSLVSNDIPNLDAAKITTGSFAIARGGTGLTALGTALQQLRVNAGATALEYFTPSSSVVLLKDFYTDQGNTSTSIGISNALYTYTVPANRLAAVGEKITAVYGGVFAANGNTKSLRIGFGTNSNMGSNSVTLNGVGWIAKVTIIRISSSAIRAIVEVPGIDPVVAEYTSVDFTVTNDLVLTGAGGGAANDVVAKMGSIKWEAAAP